MVAFVFVEFLNLNNKREVKTKPKIAVINKMLFKRIVFIEIKVMNFKDELVYIKNSNPNNPSPLMKLPILITVELLPIRLLMAPLVILRESISNKYRKNTWIRSYRIRQQENF